MNHRARSKSRLAMETAKAKPIPKAMKAEAYPEYDWSKIPTGSTFECTMDGKKTEGRIFVDKFSGDIYLCDNISCYSHHYESMLLGYKYSRLIDEGSKDNLEENNIKWLLVWLPERGYKAPVNIESINDYDVVITADNIRVGCTTITYEQGVAMYRKMIDLRKERKVTIVKKKRKQ
jgi:hypothetical protein